MIGAIPFAIYFGAIGYGGIGLAVALGFIVFGLDRTHPAAHGGWAFRPLLLPGLILLWPYILFRWQRGKRPPPRTEGQKDQRASHTRIWLLLAVVPPLILLGGLILRQGDLLLPPPQQLTAPPQ